MTDVDTNVAEGTVVETDGDDGVDDDIKVPKELRAAYNREKAENKKLRAQLMENAYKGAGLDTEAGLGKAISQLYDGEPEAAAILAYAKEEFGYEPTKQPENPNQPVITQQQTTLDNVIDSSTPVDPQTEADALAKAESEGDYATAGVIKANRLARMNRP